jgi:tRNA pseudouridine38-40 synthase
VTAGPAPGAVARLLIQYDGTDFDGWARQPGRRTVQSELERALGILLRRSDVTLTVAGRTDAGVHALAQVASYLGEPAPVRGLNALLDDDVAVLACEAAPPGFSARRDATTRAYRYRLLARSARGPLERRTALHWPYPLDLDALQACARAVIGTHDFTAFTPTETDHVSFRRHVHAARWERDRGHCDRVHFRIEADAFMRSMVRVLVGTMLEVACGRRTVAAFVALLDGRRRPEAGVTAPANGLTLVGVGYGGRRVLPEPGANESERAQSGQMFYSAEPL